MIVYEVLFHLSDGGKVKEEKSMLFSTYEIANSAAEHLLPSFEDMVQTLEFKVSKVSINTIEIDTQESETLAIIWKNA